MLTLSPELRAAVEQAHGESVFLVDPNTAQRYQLVPVFEGSDNHGAIAASVESHDTDLQDRLTAAKELAGCLKVPLGREAEFAQIATGTEYSLEASWEEEE